MGHVFAIGPLETGEEPVTAVCLVDNGLFADLEIAATPAAALWRVRARHRGETLVLEPSLADALPELDAALRVAPLPDDVTSMKVALMLSMLQGADPAAVDPDSWAALLEAVGEFSRVKPWRFVDADVGLPIDVDRGEDVEPPRSASWASLGRCWVSRSTLSAA